MGLQWLGMVHGRPVPGPLGRRRWHFRTVYAGSSLLACLLEVLAVFRKDARLAVELDSIVEDDLDRQVHTTVTQGLVPRQWLDARRIATGTFTGHFCAVTASETVAGLYPSFIGLAFSLGLVEGLLKV